MSDPNVFPFPDEFEQQVRECLTQLYDFTALQSHPLCRLLAPDLSGLDRVQHLRKVILALIDQLDASDRRSAKASRAHQILVSRYVEERPAQEVIHQLALSESQFFREHRRAVQALCYLLWDRLQKVSAAPEATPTMTVQSEVWRAFDQSNSALIEVDRLLAKAVEATGSLAEHYQVSVQVDFVPEAASFYANLTILRQTIILLLSSLIPASGPPGSAVRVRYAIAEPGLSVFEFSVQGHRLQTLESNLLQQESLREFLTVLNTQLTFRQDTSGWLVVALRLPVAEPTIVVIDDNPDVVALFQRYAKNRSFNILSVDQSGDFMQVIQNAKPSLIILDVMLPGRDGWEILQNLKSHPSTKSIPVIVCSVLDVRELALSLGATGYLKKPPERTEFIQLLEAWVDLG
jgi:CheY-like chemotaxis protein